MGNESVQQLLQYKYKKVETGYGGTAKYTIGEQVYDVPPWNHPAHLIKKVLNRVYYKHFWGIMIIGSMGDGKTSAAQCIVHHLHMAAKKFHVGDDHVNWNFSVVWAGTHEFLNQKKFYAGLPKVPTIVVFDDVSGALDQVSGSELAANFNALTTIRHVLDPNKGEIPCIVIVNFHYSKDLEKKIRSQLNMTLYTGVSMEETDNINRVSKHHSSSYKTLKHFRSIATTMFDKHKFYLNTGSGRAIEFPLQKPFRPLAAISDDWSGIILYSNKAICDTCVQEKKKVRKILPVKELYDLIQNGVYRHAGIKALQHIAINRGYTGAANDYLVHAIDHLERDFLPTYDFDWNEMVDEIRKRHNWKEKSKSRRVKKEIEFNEKVDEIAVRPENVIIDEQPLNVGVENPHP